MATLTGQSIASSYEQLLHVDTDGGGNTTTLVPIKDGDNGTTFCLQLSTTKAMIEGNGSTLYFYDEGGESISADNAGVLSIAAGAEIDLTATAVDLNGTLDVSGNAQLSGTVTVGADGSGTDVIFYSGTAGDNFTWDASEEKLTITGTDGQTALDIADGNLVVADDVDIEGDIDVNGTANLDNTDIDGTLDVSGTLTVGGNIDFNSGTIDTSTQTVTVELNQAADSFTFDGASDNILSIDASSNRVGIGTAAPDALLHLESNVTGISDAHIRLTDNADAREASIVCNAGDLILATHGTDNAPDGQIIINEGGAIYFSTGSDGATDVTIDTAGDVTLAGDLIMADGKGINFAAMTSPADAGGMTAETLKDYEEGYFTGALTCSTSGTITVNSDYDQLAYTKIGRVVHVQGFLTTASVSSPVGNVTLTGLPFTSANLTEVAGKAAVSATVNGLASGNAADVLGEISEGQTKIDLYFGDASSWVSDVAESWQANTDIRISATYIAA